VLEPAETPETEPIIAESPPPKPLASPVPSTMEPVPVEKPGEEKTTLRKAISLPRWIWLQIRDRITMLWRSFWRKHVD
jgi:hypothetical protein